MQWCTNNLNYTVLRIIQFSSLIFGCKFYRLVYSRLFNSLSLSLVYKRRYNVFTLATAFSVLQFVFCEILAVVSFWYLIYNKSLKDQIFYTSVEGLLVSIIAALFALIDIYKSEDYFEES